MDSFTRSSKQALLFLVVLANLGGAQAYYCGSGYNCTDVAALNTSVIVGLVVGLVCLLLSIVGCIWGCVRWRRNKAWQNNYVREAEARAAAANGQQPQQFYPAQTQQVQPAFVHNAGQV